jgi:diketogulonate reductase-like aldo/keto reductase
MAIPSLTLRTDDSLPQLGLGLWKVDPLQLPTLLREAIQIGYRHLDSAADYGNESATGEALASLLKDGTCQRKDLWVTSKLWNTYHAAKHVRPAIERSLSDLQLDYLDLYLIHFPIALEFVPFDLRYPPGWLHDPAAPLPSMSPARVPLSETWAAMEGLVQAGLTRNIGVCNFNTSLLRDLMAYAAIPPAVLQVESHPYLAQEKLLRFCDENQIAVTAFSPLGPMSYHCLGMAAPGESILDEPTVREISARIGKTPAQVILRWGIQRGMAVIPKTSNPIRLRENAALFDFSLPPSDCSAISALDRGRRYNDPGTFCESAFNTFMPIYE